MKERILQLTSELNQHNYNYYNLDNPTISDYEFDTLLKELEALEAKHPEFKQPDSPTMRVGGQVTKEFTTFTHLRQMLSLGNSYSREDLTHFDEQVVKLSGGNPFTYFLEHKFDGVSMSLHYEKGILVRAVTRGDGVQGDEVLLADPAFGNRKMRLSRFNEVWMEGMAFVVTVKDKNDKKSD